MRYAQRNDRVLTRRKPERRGAPRPVRLNLEAMEDRTVPATAVPLGSASLGYLGIGIGSNGATQVGDTLYFLGHAPTDPPGAIGIWHTDGTPANTQPLTDPSLAGLAITELASVGHTLYFVAAPVPADPAPPPPGAPPDANVWKLDLSGTGGAVQLTHFHDFGAGELSVAGDKVFFEHNPTLGDAFIPGGELWVSDGTASGTHTVHDFTGIAQQDLFSAVGAGNDLYFKVNPEHADDPTALWVSDGTAAGTHPVSVSAGSAAPPPVSSLAAVGDRVFFGSYDPATQKAQLWAAQDGQASLVRSFDAVPGDPVPGSPVLNSIQDAGGKVYFTVSGSASSSIWVSDGTAVGTTPVYQSGGGAGAAYVADLVVAGDAVYFTGPSGGLWKTDGHGGASAVPLPNPGPQVLPLLTEAGGQLYFLASDDKYGTELWTADGTAGGTKRLTDINPGSGSSFPFGPFAVNGHLLVIATDGVPVGPIPFTPQRLWALGDPSAPQGTATATALTASAATVQSGTPITLTATVTVSGQVAVMPAGQVVFRDVNQVYGTADLVNGTATLQVASLSVGPHALQAVFLGGNTFAESVSPAVSVTASPAGVTVALTSSDATSDFGQAVTLNAAVTPAQPGAPPVGSVTFFDGVQFLGTVPVVNGVASLQTANLSVGSHTLTATFSGDSNYASGWATLTQTVQAAASTTALQVPTTPVTAGQPVTLTATVTPARAGLPAPIGTVEFYDGTTMLGSAHLVNGQAKLTVATLSVATHRLTASFAGSLVYSGSVSPAATLAVTSPSSVGTSTALQSSLTNLATGQAVTFTAAVRVTSGRGLPTGMVTFTDKGTTLGTVALDATGRASLTTSALAAGNHTVTASYAGASGYQASASSGLAIFVRSASTTTLQASAATAVYGQQVTLTAKVSPPAGSAVVPGGTVTFKDGTTVLGFATLQNGVATLPTTALAAGAHTLTAVYAGNTLFAGSTSAPAAVAVSPAVTTLSLTPPLLTTTGTNQMLLIAAAGVKAPGAGLPTGQVSFYDGTKLLGTGALAGGKASLTFTRPGLGAHAYKAVYAGTGNFAGSTSAVQSYVVPSTTATALQATSSAYGQPVTLKATVTPTAPGVTAVTESGKVRFYADGTLLGEAATVNGVATLAVSPSVLTGGVHHLAAQFLGTTAFAASTSLPLAYQVTPGGSTLAFQVTPPATSGGTTTLRATVTVPRGAAVPTGRVTFRDGTRVLAVRLLGADGSASWSVALGSGAHALSASYEGDGNYAPRSSAATAAV